MLRLQGVGTISEIIGQLEKLPQDKLFHFYITEFDPSKEDFEISYNQEEEKLTMKIPSYMVELLDRNGIEDKAAFIKQAILNELKEIQPSKHKSY